MKKSVLFALMACVGLALPAATYGQAIIGYGINVGRAGAAGVGAGAGLGGVFSNMKRPIEQAGQAFEFAVDRHAKGEKRSCGRMNATPPRRGVDAHGGGDDLGQVRGPRNPSLATRLVNLSSDPTAQPFLAEV